MTLQRFINGKFTAQATTGVQRAATELVRALDALGDALPGQWTLLCPPGGRPPALQRIRCEFVGPAGLPLHVWEQMVLPLQARTGLLLNLAGSAPWLARRQLCLLYDAAVFDVPEAYSPRFRAWYRALFLHLARSPATLVTASAFSRRRLAPRLGVPEARLAVVPLGADHLAPVAADHTVIQRLGLQDQAFLLTVGSDNPSKNHPLLLQAFSRLQVPGLRLVMVGQRNARVFAGTASTPDPAGVLRTGPLPDADLKALYERAALLVFPSRYEGFGIPPLEAMSLGCAVVACPQAALPEVCGDAACWVEDTSPDGLAAAIQALLRDAGERAALQAAGRAHAAAFSWRAAALAMLAALPAEAAA
jgi:glycosyltransferase involved in cell wall biosynthesis